MEHINTPPKFQTKPLTAEQLYFLELSQRECSGKAFKAIHCPHCGRILGYCPVGEDTHGIYLCQKCKAESLLNGRYFKTSRNHMTYSLYLRRKYDIDI